MAEERRTVGQQKIKISGTPAPKIGSREPAPAPAAEPGSGRRRAPMIIALVLVVVVLLGAVAYVLRPWEPSAAIAEVPAAAPLGAVVAVEPISLNLAGGRYLRLGFSIQFTEDAPKELQTAKALDIAIATFSGRSVEEINDMESRAQITKQFVADLTDVYEGSVVDIYYTDLVTQ
ncbi:MAG: flagellar basal body-associated FliL family protein [Georgenia sp.]